MKRLTFFSLLFLWVFSSFGTEIVATIGSGTGSNTSTSYPAPYGNYYYGARHQFLYTSAELMAATLGAGNITGVAFNVINVNSCPTLQGFTVKMKNSTSTNLVTGWEADLTVVLNPASRTPVMGWNTYTLDVPFYWDGASNLVVEVCFNNSSWVSNGNASTQWTTGLPGAYARWLNQDAIGVCNSAGTSGATTSRPNIQLTGQAAAACTGTPDPGNTISTIYSLCPGVNFTLSLQNQTTGSGVSYQWQRSQTGFDPWENVGPNANTYTLNQTSTYSYRCQVTCSGNTGTSTPALVSMCTPNPGNTISTSNPACPGVNFTLSLQNSTTGTVTYQWQKSSTGSDPWINIGTSAATCATSQTEATYYRCMVTCGSNTGISAPLQVTINPFYNCYCSSYPTSDVDEEIFSVTVGGVTNAYNCTTVAPGPGSILKRYSNFRSLGPLFTLPQAGVTSFTILEDECDGPTYYPNGCAIWVDFNQDGDFTDAGEQVYSETGIILSPRTISGNIAVPAGALLGVTGMRITDAEGYSGAGLTPCLMYNYGETEDYLVTIVPPLTCPQPYNLIANSITPSSAILAWTPVGSETSWEYYFGDYPLPSPSGSGTPTSSNTANPVSSLNPNTRYQFYVRAACPGEFSNWSGPFTFKTPCVAMDAPVSENFDAVSMPQLPDCWSKIVSTTAPMATVETSGAFCTSWPNMIRFYNYNDPNATLILVSPQISTNLNTLCIDFIAVGNPGVVFKIGTMTDPAIAATFTEFTQLTLDNTCKQYFVALNNYSGDDQYLAFKLGTGISNMQIYLDDVRLYTPSSLSGYVYNYDGLPLEGVTITKSGLDPVISGPGGEYSFPVMPNGDQQFTCSKEGYNLLNETVHIPYGTSATHNFIMNNPHMEILPPAFYEVLLPGEVSSQNFGILNNGSGWLDWQATVNEPGPGPCNYTIQLFDTYGDGWNGGILDVRVNGNLVLDNITLPSGLGPVAFSFPVFAGDQITTFFVAGSWPMEPYYKIFDNVGTQIWYSPASNSGPPNILPGQLTAIACSDDWFTMNVTGGSVGPFGTFGYAPVTFNTNNAGVSGGLPGDTFNAEVVFTSYPNAGSITVPVTLVIADEALDPASNLMLYIVDADEGKFMLKWQFNPSRSSSHFIVIRNGQLIGTTQTNTFLDDLDYPGHYCYKVSRVYEDGSVSAPTDVICLDYPVPPGVPISNWAMILGVILISYLALLRYRSRT